MHCFRAESESVVNVLGGILGLRLTFKKETGDMNPKRIGFLGFDGMTALDLVGPAEALRLRRSTKTKANFAVATKS